jgi:hypothetical protein
MGHSRRRAERSSTVNQLETTAFSNYNALQATFSVRDRRGFSTQVNYTWSHSIDNASDGQDYCGERDAAG